MVPTKRVRPANWTDSYFVWCLRNSEDVRKASFSQKSIPLWPHLLWYTRRIKRKDCPFWIATVGGQRAGYLRLERSGAQSYVLSIAVLPEFRGQHVGLSLFHHTTMTLASVPGKVLIYAHTLPGNRQSQKFFRAVGFRELSQGRLFELEA